VHIQAHIRTRGDVMFADAPWAGRVAPGLWIESFSVRPSQHFTAEDIEYKGLTGSGFETPWVSDDQMCGTRGMAVPLVGFAVRLKPGSATSAYDCEYSGYFRSGMMVGPLRNGTPCRSTVANDPLEGIQIRLVRRHGAAPHLSASPVDTMARAVVPRPAVKTAGASARKRNGTAKPAANGKRKSRVRAAPTSSRKARSTRRELTRRQ
jgi:hypothetical protein